MTIVQCAQSAVVAAPSNLARLTALVLTRHARPTTSVTNLLLLAATTDFLVETARSRSPFERRNNVVHSSGTDR